MWGFDQAFELFCIALLITPWMTLEVSFVVSLIPFLFFVSRCPTSNNCCIKRGLSLHYMPWSHCKQHRYEVYLVKMNIRTGS